MKEEVNLGDQHGMAHALREIQAHSILMKNRLNAAVVIPTSILSGSTEC